MTRRSGLWMVLAALLPAAFLAGRFSLAQDPPRETVRALRYTILWGESVMELGHGMGERVQEIYFPEEKVACALTFQYPPLTDLARPGGGKRRPRLLAYPAAGPRNDLTGLKDAKPSPIEEIEVPAEVASEIFRFAELTQRQQRESWRLGHEIASRGLMRALPRAPVPESK